jgi:hypothetical protein
MLRPMLTKTIGREENSSREFALSTQNIRPWKFGRFLHKLSPFQPNHHDFTHSVNVYPY